jgi:UDP-N-acetylmuramyl-tripeptide synthetase
MAQEIHLLPTGSSFQLKTLDSIQTVVTKLIGKHNIYNVLAAIATAQGLGIPVDAIQLGLENLSGIPGRLELIHCGQNFTVVVDYAHTEDALINVLKTLRALTQKRILTLFGCGGDRDRSKRPRMGRVAVEWSDYVVVTSDNPRSEDPASIAKEIEVGILEFGKKNYEVILDRKKAIEHILHQAKQGDIVFLAGKGHETIQILKDRSIHFDDREIAKNILTQSILG